MVIPVVHNPNAAPRPTKCNFGDMRSGLARWGDRCCEINRNLSGLGKHPQTIHWLLGSMSMES